MKVKRKRETVLFPRQLTDEKASHLRRGAEDLLGAKAWSCHGCHEKIGGEPFRVVDERWLYHAACVPEEGA